jgi:transcription initiation factor TFIID subunit 6
MEIYFKKVTGAVLALKVDLDTITPQTEKLTPPTKAFFAVSRSLSADLGLYQLVPYFTRFISESVGNHLRDVVRLKALMRMTKALLSNPNLTVEPYLHQVMPAILTCIVGKQLCEDTLQDDHWSLREYAAQLVAYICDKYV